MSQDTTTGDHTSNHQQTSGDMPISGVEHWFSNNGADEIHRPVGNGNPMIARGAFGEISIGIRTGCSDRWHLAAVKTIIKSTTGGGKFSATKPKLARELFHEICALRRLNGHPNIVELLAVYPASQRDLMSGKSVSLAFSYCPTDLYLSLEWRRRTLQPLLPFNIIKTIAQDMFSAINHCHSNGILHLDIKPGNFLVSSAGYITLCDFGLAKAFERDTKEAAGEESRGLCTLYYRPPEILLGGLADNPAVDNYSAGLVLAELLTGLPLFQGDNLLGQLAIVFEVLGTPDEAVWPGARDLPDYGKLQFLTKTKKPLEMLLPRALESPFLLDFLYSLIVLNPTKRMGAADSLEHQWFTSPPLPAPRTAIQQELIPSVLREKILLTNPSRDLTVASKQALDQAAVRRTFLSSSHLWKDHEKHERVSLQQRVCQLCPILADKIA